MNKKIRPIIIFGYVFIGLSLVGVLFFYLVSLQVSMEVSDFYFITFVALWYFLTGLGVIKLKGWGYYLFKVSLYLLFLSFPIGTIISYKTLSYMKRNDIKGYFFAKGRV